MLTELQIRGRLPVCRGNPRGGRLQTVKRFIGVPHLMVRHSQEAPLPAPWPVEPSRFFELSNRIVVLAGAITGGADDATVFFFYTGCYEI
jgi:hypothetical protein